MYTCFPLILFPKINNKGGLRSSLSIRVSEYSLTVNSFNLSTTSLVSYSRSINVYGVENVFFPSFLLLMSLKFVSILNFSSLRIALNSQRNAETSFPVDLTFSFMRTTSVHTQTGMPSIDSITINWWIVKLILQNHKEQSDEPVAFFYTKGVTSIVNLQHKRLLTSILLDFPIFILYNIKYRIKAIWLNNRTCCQLAAKNSYCNRRISFDASSSNAYPKIWRRLRAGFNRTDPDTAARNPYYNSHDIGRRPYYVFNRPLSRNTALHRSFSSLYPRLNYTLVLHIILYFQ